MGIEQICDSITKLFEMVRLPLKYVPAVLLICGAMKRPGLSAMLLTARIMEKAGAIGLPTGTASDGSPNLWCALLASGMETTVDAIKTEGGVQTGTAIGGIQITATGANGGGPIVVQGVNTNAVHSEGIFG